MHIRYLVLGLLLFTSVNDAAQLSYHNQTGKQSFYYTVVETNIEKDKKQIKIKAPHKIEEYICSYDDSTLKWSRVDTMISSNITVTRKKNKLILNGNIYKNKFKGKVEKIDHNPWFQALEPAIRFFISSNNKEQMFWILSPERLTLHKMIAKEKESVDLKINGVLTHATKVRVTFPGWGGYLWSAYYWFRQSDGIFLRYEGRNGPPGTKKTIITLAN